MASKKQTSFDFVMNKNEINEIPDLLSFFTKEQLAFYKKFESIKQLEMDLKRVSEEMPMAIEAYKDAIQPFETNILQLQIQKICAIHTFIESNKFNKSELELLKEFIIFSINNIFEESLERDQKLQLIFLKYAGITHKKLEDLSHLNRKKHTENMFNNVFKLDFTYDLNKSRSENFNEANRVLEEDSLEKNRKWLEEKANTPKTKVEFKAEEKARYLEELKNKSIKGIYIEIIKNFNIDTEQNVAYKSEKEDILKQINMANNAKDIYKFLKIESDYFKNPSEIISKISYEEIKMYNEILNILRKQLELELYIYKSKNKLVFEGNFYKNSKPQNFLLAQKSLKETEISILKTQILELEKPTKNTKYQLLYDANTILEKRKYTNTFETLMGF